MNTLQLNDVQHVQAAFLMFSQLAHMSNLSNYFNSDVVLRLKQLKPILIIINNKSLQIYSDRI